MAEPVRVLVVDDSSFFRKRIRRYLEQSPQITVVGEAGNGEEALQLNQSLSPDLITMDVAMPVLDGISAVRRIMREHPTHVIMFSALTRDGARATLDALDAGAVDFLPKMGEGNTSAEDNGTLLRNRVLEIASKRRPSAKPLEAEIPRQVASAPASSSSQKTRLVVIGASTGGPVAVQDILTRLPANCPYPVLVAVHMPKMFTGTYAERLQGLCAVEVLEAADGMRLQPGRVLIAPGGQQTEVRRSGDSLVVRVSDGGDHLYKPCVDLTFASVAHEVGGTSLAIVLTGMGSDGAKGAKELKKSGARIWAQDEASSVVYGMPAAVARDGSADSVMSLSEIGRALLGVAK